MTWAVDAAASMLKRNVARAADMNFGRMRKMIQAVAIRVSGDKKMADAMADAAAMQEIERLRAELEYTQDQLAFLRYLRDRQHAERLEKIMRRIHRPTRAERVRRALIRFLHLFVQPIGEEESDENIL